MVQKVQSIVALVRCAQRYHDLFLDSLIVVKSLERNHRKFESIIMSDKLDLIFELQQRCHELLYLDALFDAVLGFHAERLHASASFVYDQHQLLALPPIDSTSIGPQAVKCIR